MEYIPFIHLKPDFPSALVGGAQHHAGDDVDLRGLQGQPHAAARHHQVVPPARLLLPAPDRRFLDARPVPLRAHLPQHLARQDGPREHRGEFIFRAVFLKTARNSIFFSCYILQEKIA